MIRFRNSLGWLVLSLGGTATAASAAELTSYSLAPEVQRLQLSAVSDFGFPLGVASFTVKADCTRPGTPAVEAWKEVGISTVANPEVAAAALKNKLVEVSEGRVTLHTPQGDLSAYCRDGVVVTNISQLLQKQANIDFDGYLAIFGIRQWPELKKVALTYPILSDERRGMIIPSPVSLYLNVPDGLKGKKTIQDIMPQGIALDRSSGLFLIDHTKNQLIPLMYAGNRAGLKAIVGFPVGDIVEMIYARDFNKPEKWQLLTFDLAKGEMWTKTVSKPEIPFAK